MYFVHSILTLKWGFPGKAQSYKRKWRMCMFFCKQRIRRQFCFLNISVGCQANFCGLPLKHQSLVEYACTVNLSPGMLELMVEMHLCWLF
nr:hypothetical protein CFP56_58265 [Quercus suber]